MPWSDWIRTVEIEPSLYAADFSILGEQIDLLMRAGVRVFHFDVGDGHFVEPVTMGPIVLQSISERIHRSAGRVDVHLMVDNPPKYFAPVAAAGGDGVTFHFEATTDISGTIEAARSHELLVGVAFNPNTDPEDVAAVTGDADLVLCMGIYPGYSGEPFRPETIDRVARLRTRLPQQTAIQVDGGVGHENINELRRAGATLFVAGTAIFGHEDLAGAYRRLVNEVS
jgi:ribulose-phosphate 3-epimerase